MKRNFANNTLLVAKNVLGTLRKRRLLVNPYRPEIQTEFCCFLGEDDRNSEGDFYESPDDRCVPSSSPATFRYYKFQYFEEPRKPRDESFENNS